MKTRDAESVLVIQAIGFIGQHLVCRLIGLCDNAMAQGALKPGSPLPPPRAWRLLIGFAGMADSTGP